MTHAFTLASSFLAGSILSLALPVALVVVVAAWYVRLWRRGAGERRAEAPGSAEPKG